MWKRIALLMGILTAFAILVMPVVSAQNIIYFAPQHGVIQEPSTNMNVEVRANLSADSPIDAWRTNIAFDHTCVNITGVTFPEPATGWSHTREKYHEGGIEISALRFACGDAGSDILLANLTVHCEQWDCTSPLNFTGIVIVARFIGCTETNEKYHATWINGTVTIETEEQNGKERHTRGDGGNSGSRGAGGASQPSPSPTPTPTATPAPAETPTLAPSTMSPSTTPTPTPTTPLSVPRIPLWLLILIVIAVVVIAGIIIMVLKR